MVASRGALQAVNPWMREPDTRSGQKPDAMKGTLTARDLTAGAIYLIYRWDSVAEAFTCKDLDIAEHLKPRIFNSLSWRTPDCFLGIWQRA